MSRFKRIKNTSTKKSSVSIDEKIAALNKELEKTGMLSEIVMTTDTVYSTSTYVPPQERIVSDVPNSSNIGGDGFTQSSAGSGNEGEAPSYSSLTDLYNSTVNRSIFKSTSYEGVGSYGIVIGPSFGAGTTYGIIEGGNIYRAILGGFLAGGTRGSANYKAIYDARAAAPSTYSQEQIDDAKEHWKLAVQVEAALIEIGYDNSKFNIPWQAWRSPQLFENQDGIPSFAHPTKGTLYLHGFSLLGSVNTYTEREPRRETTTDPIRRGTEDPPIYPGPIPPGLWPPLSPPAFNWLKKKAGDPTSPKDPKDPEKTETEIEKGEDEEKEKQKLLADARRIDAQNQRLADSMTSSDPRNLSASVTLAIGGTYIVVKSLYSLTLAAIAAGYSLYQLQKLQSDFEADWENNIVWRSIDSTKVDPFDSEATRAEKDAAFDEAQQKAREKDQQAAREANEEVAKANEELQNAEESGNETRINIAKEKLANAEKNRKRVARVNAQNKKNRRNAKKKRYEGTEKLTGKQGWTGPKPTTPNDPNFGMFSNSFEPQGDVLSEGVGLGLYEPEAMNVDLSDIRKGVMPEYPKKPPAEMIDGYHQDSKLKPKEFKDKYLLKIDEKDLLRNHRLKRSEVDEMMNTIKMINDHLNKHPEDLIHAQMRYPIDDPRLAELNWKMDQMLEAGEEYMDSNFKENQTLFKRATDRTKKNIKLTDPEYVQQHYDELRGTIKSKPRINKKSPSRFFKKEKKKSSMEEINDKIKQLDKDLLI